MSQITLVFAIAPAIAPVIGGMLLNTLGWRSIFWALLAFTLLVLAWTARSLPETHPPHLRIPLHPRTMWRNYRAVLGKPEYPAARLHSGAQLLRVLPLHRGRAGVPRRPARRVDAGDSAGCSSR